MKKIGITIQQFLDYKVWFARLQDFTPFINLSYINQHLFISYRTNKKDVPFDNANDFISELINKKKTQRFNCQNKHYEKNCHFEKLDAAIQTGINKKNSHTLAVASSIFHK